MFRLHVIVFNMRKMRNATRPNYVRYPTHAHLPHPVTCRIPHFSSHTNECILVLVFSPLAKVINYAMSTTVGKRSKELYHLVKKKLGFVEDVVVIVRRVKKIKKTVGKAIFDQRNIPHFIFPSFLY